MKVAIYQLTGPKATAELIGEITWDGKQLIGNPMSPRLQGFMQEPLLLGGRLIFPDTNPQEWLQNLSRGLSGGYVWAEEIKEVQN